MAAGAASVACNVAQRMGVLIIELRRDDAHVGAFRLALPPGAPDTSLPRPKELGARRDVSLVLHTSGTTAKPKIVPLHHENLAVGCTCIASCLELTCASVNINVMPLYHIHAISINLLASLTSGASTVAAPGFDASHFLADWLVPPSGEPARTLGAVLTLAAVDHPKPTWYSSVPTIHQLILAHAENDTTGTTATALSQHALEFVRSESSVLPLPVGERLEALLGVVIAQTYAMTESMPISANPCDSTRKLHSVGPSAGPEVRSTRVQGLHSARTRRCACG